MSVKSYSTTASSNTTVNSVSTAEGMAPSDVNDAMREIMADIRSEVATKGTDIASAATVDLDGATGDFVDVTGTTTITSLGTVSEGIRRTVRFTGALTLTHNATSLILPGGANITTANGDIARFRSLGSGNWVCEFYSKASGEAVDDSNYAKLDADNTFTSTDAGAAGPTLSLHHDSASPAADDTVGAIELKGNDSAGNETIYARLRAVLADATDAAEDGRLSLDAMTAGTLTAVLHLAQGIWTPNATGGDPGADKINASGFQIDGDDGAMIVDSLLLNTGFVRFSNGFVFNWGRPSVAANTSSLYTLSQAVVGEVWGIVATGNRQVLTDSDNVYANPQGETQIRITNGAEAQTVYFIAWGSV